MCLDLGLSSAAGQLLVLEPLRVGVASWERRENWGGGWDGVTAVPTVACCGLASSRVAASVCPLASKGPRSWGPGFAVRGAASRT